MGDRHSSPSPQESPSEPITASAQWRIASENTTSAGTDETDASRSPVTVRIDGDPGDVGLFVDALRLAMSDGWRFGDVDYSDTRTGGAATVRAEWT